VGKGYPGNSPDPYNQYLHYFDSYRFDNPGTTAACFTFTLAYDVATTGQRWMVAYMNYNPTDISSGGYLTDVGNTTLDPPQTMGLTVPGGASVDIVIFAIPNTTDAFPGTGAYTLSCTNGAAMAPAAP
jgi:hypothetical protein